MSNSRDLPSKTLQNVVFLDFNFLVGQKLVKFTMQLFFFLRKNTI